MKKRLVRFGNYDFRNLFLKMSLPILESMRITTSFWESLPVCNTPAAYYTILSISDLLLKLTDAATFSARSKMALLNGAQVRSSQR